MKKRKLLAVIMSVLCVAAAVPSVPAFADGQKVVTLGADLSEDQKQAILRYFGIAGQSIQTLTITNQDERDHLGSYVPLEQIGTHTYSCALVNPTNTGGIQVRTANLTWVTSNMIATTLSTSGVVNCEVLAAAPFEVSGTGALTGILMAYESAVGTELDTSKKEVATQELITTTTIANNIGQAEATDIVNEAKMQVVQGSVVNENDIDVIITDVAEQENIDLSEEDRSLLKDLMQQIAEQDYNYEDMKETLERVEQNMDVLMDQQAAASAETPGTEAPSTEAPAATDNQTEAPATEAPVADSQNQTETPETLPEDSILANANPEALGESVVTDSTLPEEQTEAPQPEQTEAPQSETVQPAGDIEITSSDEYTENPSSGQEGDVNIEILPEQSDTNPATESTPEQTEAVADTEYIPEQTETNPAIEVIPEQTDADTYIENIPEQTDAGTDTEYIPEQTDASTEITPEQTDAGTEIIPEQTEAPADEYGIDTMMPELEDPMFAVPDEPTAPILTTITAEEMVFSPLYDVEKGELLPAGINELTICFQRDDMIAGTGAISLINGFDDSVIETIQANDEQKVAVSPLDAETLAGLGWDIGCKATIKLENPIAQTAFCYVTMTENAFTSVDGSAMTPAIEDTQTWTIQTSEYGFCIDKTNLTAGSTVSGQIMMDGTAATVAYIEQADPAMISFDQGEFTASGSLTATLNAAGKTGFQVSFYDEAGTLLNTINYELEIQ